MTRQRLDDLKLTKLALVDRGANPGARALLAKRHPSAGGRAQPGLIQKLIGRIAGLLKGRGHSGLEPAELAALAKEAESFDGTLAEAENFEALWELLSAIGESLRSIVDDDTLSLDQKRIAVIESITQFQAAVGNLPALTTEDPAAGADGSAPEDGEGTMDEVTKAAIADIVAKAIEPVRTDLAKATEANVALQETVTKQAATIASLQAGQTDAALITKARAVVGEAPVDVTKVSGMLKQLDADGQAALEELLGTTRELAKGNALFTAFGSAGQGPSPEVEARIAKAIAAVRAAEPQLTVEQATAKAYETDPELYEDALAEQEG